MRLYFNILKGFELFKSQTNSIVSIKDSDKLITKLKTNLKKMKRSKLKEMSRGEIKEFFLASLKTYANDIILHDEQLKRLLK